MSNKIIYTEDIAMIGEIAALYQVPKPTVQGWMRRDGFPKPVAQLKVGAVYDLSEVKRWRAKASQS